MECTHTYIHTYTHTYTHTNTHTHGSDAISPSQQVARGDNKFSVLLKLFSLPNTLADRREYFSPRLNHSKNSGFNYINPTLV